MQKIKGINNLTQINKLKLKYIISENKAVKE